MVKQNNKHRTRQNNDCKIQKYVVNFHNLMNFCNLCFAAKSQVGQYKQIKACGFSARTIFTFVIIIILHINVLVQVQHQFRVYSLHYVPNSVYKKYFINTLSQECLGYICPNISGI